MKSGQVGCRGPVAVYRSGLLETSCRQIGEIDAICTIGYFKVQGTVTTGAALLKAKLDIGFARSAYLELYVISDGGPAV
ncbi:hypothetical protein D9M68_845850 [compost metagenome]